MILYTDQIQRANSDDPIVGSSDIKGGIHSVKTHTDLVNLSTTKLEAGMLCYVQDENKYYKYTIDNTWEEAKFGGSGIQMYTDSQLKELEEKNDVPDEYIHIPNPNELNIVQNGSSYLDIIFKTLRALQSEVSKLKNSFNYGITSYNDSMTAMSSTTNDDVQEEEPLWAIDPEDLSEISDASVIIGESDLVGSDLELFDNYTQIKSTAYKEFYNLLDFESCPENKLCVYTKGILKTNGDISLELKDEDDNILIINLGNHISKNSFRNILIVLNRQVLNEDTEEFSGVNYLYLQVTDSQGNILQDGYINQNSIISNNIQYLDTRYYISKITFQELDLYKCNFYVKDSSFTNEGNGLSTLPDDSDFKFGAAHITIRSVKTKEVLTQVSSHLLNNELVFVESENQLYIKNQNQIISLSSGSSIGGGGNNNNTMTEQEILEILKNAGIITADNKLNSVKLNDIEQLTFTHSESGQKFNVHVNADGELLVDNITSPPQPDTYTNVNQTFRGAVAQHNMGSIFNEDNKVYYGSSANPQATGDRVRFGSWYIPTNDQVTFNCTHDFIELANSGTTDYPLEGARLYIVKGDTYQIDSKQYLIDASLDKFILKGVIKAGSTYLIRGAKHTTKEDIIKVDSYDYELRNHYSYTNDKYEEVNNSELYSLKNVAALALLNSQYKEDGTLKEDLVLIKSADTINVTDGENTIAKYHWTFNKNLWTSIKNDYFAVSVLSELIDCITLVEPNALKREESVQLFGKKQYTRKPDHLIKDSFELDPSRQGFLSLSTKVHESTNYRLDKVNAEYVPLTNKNISFFHTEDQFPVSNYTPKASKYNKTICTDKSKLNTTRPNMVSCFYGINMQTTRCFNWVSVQERNEYVWIRQKGSTSWDNRFESYKGHTSELTNNNANDVYTTGTMNRVKYSQTVIDSAYKRIKGMFPGSNYSYCAHKCVVYIQDAPENAPITYEYIVGPTLSNGQPNLDLTSNIQSFTLYPTDYKPIVYQISDQQGFNWIEYQVWAAAAKQILKQINQECNIITKCFPVLINTGDCTQNGTRYNEWLDYYNAGYCLFDHLEQLNVVGNNDLANAYNHSALGTGNDEGKSNPYYFHLVNCYEVDNSANYDIVEDSYKKLWNHPLIVNNIFFPSTYYCYFNNLGYLLVNSELTVDACKGLFKVTASQTSSNVYNLYTGYLQSSSTKLETYSDRSFANTIKNMITSLNNHNVPSKNIIVACHEMPFTVITDDYLKTAKGLYVNDRSCTGDSKKVHASLVGSHMNRISYSDTEWGNDYNYWFSKMLQSNNIKLCIGGHKHSYTSTFPVIEMTPQLWTQIESKIQDQNLKDLIQSLYVYNDKIEYSKLFLVITGNSDNVINMITSDAYCPILQCSAELLSSVNSQLSPVVYFMCQATGYKLKSNKELPSINQAFSIIKPETNVVDSKPHYSQESPMFATIKYNNTTFDISLYRIINIKDTKATKITEFSYNGESKLPMVTERLILGTLINNYYQTNNSIQQFIKTKKTMNYWFTDSPTEFYSFSISSSDRCWIDNNNLNTADGQFQSLTNYDADSEGVRVYPYFEDSQITNPNYTLKVVL